jgi:hypothetical protein
MEDDVIHDPLGDPVRLAQGLCDLSIAEPFSEIYDHVTDVIRKPALIMLDQNKELRYYFRSIGWHHTILISVQRQNAHWIAHQCQLNPTANQLTSLFAGGEKIY